MERKEGMRLKDPMDLLPFEGASRLGNGSKKVLHFGYGQDVFLCTSKFRPLSAFFHA